jgi:hypothetical protein
MMISAIYATNDDLFTGLSTEIGERTKPGIREQLEET